VGTSSLSDGPIEDYEKHVQNFLTVRDGRVASFLDDDPLRDRKLWPEPMLPLNPAYVSGACVSVPCTDVGLLRLCADIL